MKKNNCPVSRWQLLKAQLTNLPPKRFAEQLKKEERPVLLDVRTAEEFAGGSMPGAQNMDYLGESFWEEFEQLEPNRPVYVFCRTERRSLRVCTLLQNAGFKKVYNLDGGLIHWQSVFSGMEVG